MATDIGANIVEDDLIFGFDSGYGVADNSTATRFYPGEPTVNYVSDSPSQGGWSGGIDVLDSGQKKFKCHISNFSANPGAGWRSFTWNMNDHSGSDVTISLDFETVGPNGTMAWIMVGQTNTHTSNNSGAGQYMGYSATSERTQKSTTSKERVTWTGTIGSTGTASQPSGHIGFTIWINNGVPGNQDAYVIVSNVQIEKKDHATPFVNGTRSSTAGLIDLKRTNDINIANVSFTSTGQPTFDGTNDYIYIDEDILNVSSFTVEAIVNITSTGNNNKPIFTCGNLSSTGIWFFKHRSGLGNRLVMHGYDGVNPRVDVTSTNVVPDAENTYVAVTFNGTSYQLYINGVADGNAVNDNAVAASNDNYIGRQSSSSAYLLGDIPVLKIYSVALSADEIKQNYNAYKKRFDL
jgi:hypothetical protein